MKKNLKGILGGLLTGLFAFALACGALRTGWCWGLSAAAALVGFLSFRGQGHGHGGMLHIDQIAQRSGLIHINPGCKVAFAVAALVLCVASPSPLPPLAALATMAAFTIRWGRVPFSRYRSLLLLPASFVAMSTAVILFDFSTAPQGLLDLPLFGGYLSVTADGRRDAILTACRALGAVSCLFFMSLTTPLHEIVGVLRRIRVPAIVIELMYLIYRFLFILLDRQQQRITAADARLGFGRPGQSLRTYGRLSAGVLAEAFRRASQCFDAMEARCYDGSLRFLEREKPLRAKHVAFACCYLAALGLLVCLAPGRWMP